MIPDFFEAITAHRRWDVFPNGLLIGMAIEEPWIPMEPFKAHCFHGRPNHIQEGKWVSPPVWGCSCGIYATKQTADMDTVSSYSFFDDDSQVWGTVKLWGHIIEHQEGYRAEFAYPSELNCHSEKTAKMVSELYGVPCTFIPPMKREELGGIDDFPYFYQSMVSAFLGGKRGGKTVAGLSAGAVYFMGTAVHAKYLGVVTDLAPEPHPIPINPVVKPTWAQIRAVKASPWQKRQTAAHILSPPGSNTDWRSTLRAMVYVDKDKAKAEEMVDGLTVKVDL